MRAVKTAIYTQTIEFNFASEDLGEGAAGTYRTPVNIPPGALILSAEFSIETDVLPVSTEVDIVLTSPEATEIFSVSGLAVYAGFYYEKQTCASAGLVYIKIPAGKDIASGSGKVTLTYIIGAL